MLAIVDPGHGGRDFGAVSACGVREKDINLEVAARITPRIRDLGAGWRAALTRHSDRFVELPTRYALANNLKADLFVSIHCNAAENSAAHGFEIWTSPGETPADKLATSIYNVVALRFKDTLRMRHDYYTDGDPDKEADYAVLSGTIMPAVLVELSFLSNPAGVLRLQLDAFQAAIADAIARGISIWSNKPW